MTEAGSARQLDDCVCATPAGGLYRNPRRSHAPLSSRLIRFNPFHMEGRNRRVGAKSEVRVDE